MMQLKRTILVATALAAMFCGSGCATSLQPLVSDDVRTDVDGMTGQWVVESTRHAPIKVGSRLRIERRGAGSHDLVLDQVDEKSHWHADLVKLGETTFVDLFPEIGDESEKPEAILVIATHVFFVIEMKENELRLYGFDHSKLDSQAMEERVAVASPRNQRIVFVAEPKRMQEFFAKHGPANLQKDPIVVLKKIR